MSGCGIDATNKRIETGDFFNQLKKFIKENYSKKIYVKVESVDLQHFITINEIKTLIK